MNELALTRSKAKHPPAKTVDEQRRIKDKVEKSNANRRQKNMTNDLKERMDRFERKLSQDELRLSAERDARIAAEVDAKATSLMNADPTLDYSAATRLALAEDERFQATNDTDDHGDDLAAAVERRMKADPEHYSDADEGDAPVGSVQNLSDAEYESQVKEAMRNRGYEV